MPNSSSIAGLRVASTPAERLVLLLALAGCLPVAAAPAPASDDSRKARAGEPETSIELLEFLGRWETATGAWNETIPDSERTPPARRPKETARD